MLNKLKIDYDVQVNYLRLGFFSNSLLLNKKMYLLYNIFNRKREFFFLKKKERQIGSYFFNYLNYKTLNNDILEKKKKKFDYFFKWSSSFLYSSDINLKNIIFNLNRKKFFLNTKISLNYTVCDEIFVDYYFNKKKAYLYLNKNMFFLNVLFKLNKKEKMQFSNFSFFDIYDNYTVLNENYYDFLNNQCWNNRTNLNFFFKIKFRIKEYILKKIYIFISSYFKKEKFFFLKNSIFFEFLDLPKLISLVNMGIKNNNYIKNDKKKKFFFLKNLVKTAFFQKKFNKFFFRYQKKYMLNLLKKQFLPLISFNILKNLKKRNLLNILRKKKKNNRKFFTRNFYIFKKFLPNIYLRESYKRLKKKLKKKHNYRLIKKLKKFNYISGRGTLTRLQVYKKFKSKIIAKLKKKKKLKEKYFYLKTKKYRFNLFVYNNRNGYRNRMKAKQLKLLISPKYFYKHNRLSDYRDIQKLEEGLNWNELPDNIMKKFKKKWIKEDNTLGTTLYKNKKIRDLVLFKNYRKWKKKKFFSFFQYKKMVKHKKRSEKFNKIKKKFVGFNREFRVNKHTLWVFQKMFIFFKNLNVVKNYNNANMFLNYYHKYYKIIFTNFFFLIFNIFKMFILRYLYKKKIKWSYYLKNIKKKISFLMLFLQFFFLKQENKKQKKTKIKKKKKKKKPLMIPLPKLKTKPLPTPNSITPTPKKEDTGFLSIYNDNQHTESIENWQVIINNTPWMTFKDKRIFDKKNKFYLSLIFNKVEKKKFLDWIKKTENRINNARLSYKNKKYNFKTISPSIIN